MDLESIYDFISRDSATYAKRVVQRITEVVGRLHTFPESGRHLPEFPQLPHREVIVGNYRTVYRYLPAIKEVRILSVVHGSRLMSEPKE